MNEEKNTQILDKAIAEIFLADPGSIDISKYRFLSDPAAEILASFGGYLFLDGLAELSDAAAESLSKYQGSRLSLSGLTHISDGGLHLLSRAAEELNLSSLSEISEKNFKALIQNRESLSLGIRELNDRQAEVLELYHGSELFLNELCELSDTDLDAISRLKLNRLSLTGLRNISSALAERLASISRRTNLSLPGSPQITKPALQKLFAEDSNEWHDQEIELCGNISLPDYECVLTDSILNERWALKWKEVKPGQRSTCFDCSLITPAGAKIVSKMGNLAFYNLQELSESVATILAKSKGGLTIGIEKIGVEIARCLACRKEDNSVNFGLALRLNTLDKEVATELAKSSGRLSLIVDGGLTDTNLEVISKRQGALDLSNWTELSDKAAEILSKHQGELNLSGLTKLSDAAAESLSRHRGVVLLFGLEDLGDVTRKILSKNEDIVFE